MARIERISEILNEELRGSGKRMQEVGHQIFAEVLKNGVEPGKTCNLVRARIAREFGKNGKRKALDIFAKIKDRISVESMQAGFEERYNRISAQKMKAEIDRAYEVIERNGRGIVYLGSARTKPGEASYDAARELGGEVSRLLSTTSWSGAGPGQMEAPLLGAKEAGGNVAGIKIQLEDEQSTFEQAISPVLDPRNVAECKYFGPRKVGLADAAMRKKPEDRTAIITTDGGFGTRDELYEYLVLKQLKKLGTDYEVPIILNNQDHCFEELLADIAGMLKRKKISSEDLKHFVVKNNNREILDYLADFYKIPEEERGYMTRELKY